MELQPQHYDRRSQLLHWSIALLIPFLWIGAHLIDNFAKGAPRVDARSVHIIVGAGLLFLMLY
ncbi:MAG: cytochrome b, partial [Alphaproteobacteria bacterium]|nr:cytochrome b [Alphaproteobacteria bacterium]